MENYLLAVDIGTTSTKGLAIRPDGEVLSHFQKEYPTHYPVAGSAEQDPNEVFEAVIEAISQTVRLSKAGPPIGVTFSSAMHSLMAVGTDGKPLTQLITWADTRSSVQAAALRHTQLGKEIYHETGTPVHPMSPFCKLIWIKEERPELFASASHFVSAKEYVFNRLFGNCIVDYSIASASGLFDIHQLTWSAKALSFLGLKAEKLSLPVSPFHQSIRMNSALANRMNIPVHTPFIAGANDGCLAQLGCGAMNPGDLSVTIGTSGAVRMATNRYFRDEQQRIFNYRLDDHTFVAGGATNNGAVLLSWFETNIEGGKPDGAAFVAEACSMESSEGLIFLPFILGERAPMYDPLAKGVFFGIGVHHRKAHFKRAILEGICFELKSIMKAVEEVVHPVERIIASGGFVKSDAWVQLLSDILGKTIIVNSQDDASSLGAALQGFQSLGVKANFQNRQSTGNSFTPEDLRHRHYNSLFEIAEPLYGKLKDDFAKLDKLK